MKTFFLSILISIKLICISQNQLNPVSWKAVYKELSALEGEIIITANIDDKWHIYSQRATDAGPIPTTFSITTHANVILIGEISEENTHEIFDKSFDAKLFVIDKIGIFKQKIKRNTKNESTIKLSVEYMTCNDAQCLPPKTVELSITIPATNIKTAKK